MKLSRAIRKTLKLTSKAENYALLPVWIYSYHYKDKVYPFHVNGQTGKIVGKVPISARKVVGYGITLWGILTAIMVMLQVLLRLGVQFTMGMV